jgi:hypothetical protein
MGGFAAAFFLPLTMPSLPALSGISLCILPILVLSVLTMF